MAKSFPDQLGQGLFVPTTNVWDPSEIEATEVTSEAFKELMVRLYQNLNVMSLALNLKVSGYFVQEEFVNGKVFFPNTTLSATTAQVPTFRQDFTKVVNFGALPNNTTKRVPHGLTINSNFTLTHFYASCTNPVGFTGLTLPYASATPANIIEMSYDANDVIITTGSDRTAFTVTLVVFEFLKQ